METRGDREMYIRMWQQNQMLNSGCGNTLMYAVIAMVVVVLGFTSCATKKKIVEDTQQTTIVAKDSTNTETVKIDSTDVQHSTNVTEKDKTEKETIVEKSDSTVVTVDEQGNVKKKEIWHKEKESVKEFRDREKTLKDSLAVYRLAKDSLRQYREKCDSLTEKLSHKEKEVVEVTKIPKIYRYALIFSILCCIFAFVKLTRWLQIR